MPSTAQKNESNEFTTLNTALSTESFYLFNNTFECEINVNESGIKSEMVTKILYKKHVTTETGGVNEVNQLSYGVYFLMLARI